MSTTFKVGDKVRRRKRHISNFWVDQCKQFDLKPETTLTVRGISYGELFLEEITTPIGGFDPDRFEYATKKEKSGLQKWFKRLDNARTL